MENVKIPKHLDEIPAIHPKIKHHDELEKLLREVIGHFRSFQQPKYCDEVHERVFEKSENPQDPLLNEFV